MYKKIGVLIFLVFATVINMYAQNNLEIKGNITFSTAPSSANLNSFTFSPLVEIGYKLHDEYYFAIKFGATYTKLERLGYNTESRTDLSNPIVIVGYLDNKVTKFSTIDMLLNLGIPLATFPGNISKNRLSEFNYNNANNMYGWKESLSWFMNVVPISFTLVNKNEISEKLGIHILINPIYMISINSRPDRQAINANLNIYYKLNDISFNIGTNYFYSVQSIENDDKDKNIIYIGNSVKLEDYTLGAEINLNLNSPKGAFTKNKIYYYGIMLKINKNLNL